MSKKRKPRRYRELHRINLGSPPGTIRDKSGKFSIHVLAYSGTAVVEHDVGSIKDAKRVAVNSDVVWIDIVGVDNSDLLRSIGVEFGIHALSLEDVANVGQRAKWEKFDSYDYYVMRMVNEIVDQKRTLFQSEQLSLFHIGKFVISIQQFVGDCLDPLRRRIREGQGYVRQKKADYLVYAMIDNVIDYYFPIVDKIGEQLDLLDSQLMENDSNFSAETIHQLRSQLVDLGRWLRPNREMFNNILRDDSSNLTPDTQLFLRDCYDHVVQLSETIESYRDVCADLRAYHLAAISNRTNEVMKTLTIISAIFIPLSFLAGVYGMNFDYMPELKWSWGYFGLLTAMLGIAIGLLFWFRRRGWFD